MIESLQHSRLRLNIIVLNNCTVPIELENLTEEVEHAVNDYELVEEFYYPLRQVFKLFSGI